MYKKAIKEIKKVKENLIEKAQKKGLWENFGQKEINELEEKLTKMLTKMGYDKYNYSIDSEDILITKELERLRNWTTNFDLINKKVG